MKMRLAEAESKLRAAESEHNTDLEKALGQLEKEKSR